MRWSATQFGNDSKIENTVAAIQISSRLNAALLGTQQSKSDAWGYFKAMAVKFSCGQTALGANVSAGAACTCSPTQMGLGTKIAVHEWPINRATTLGAHAQAGGDGNAGDALERGLTRLQCCACSTPLPCYCLHLLTTVLQANFFLGPYNFQFQQSDCCDSRKNAKRSRKV